MKTLTVLMFLANSLFAQLLAQKSEFDIFGTGRFPIGMSETEAVSILRKMGKKYELDQESRTNSTIFVVQFAQDRRQYLDGTICLQLYFEGKNLFKNDRILTCVRLVWGDWKTNQDAAAKILEKKLSILFGEPTERVEVLDIPMWKLNKGNLSIRQSKFLEVLYERPLIESEDLK